MLKKRLTLPVFSMEELFEMVFPEERPIIENILYPGTYLYAGDPKIGKSYLMAQIAYHVSTGKPMWGYSVHKSRVLYLALEDKPRRLQKRLYRMFGARPSPNLMFVSEEYKDKDKDKDYLLNQLSIFLEIYPDTSLIIIDTLQKIRESESDTQNYACDYDIIGKLKEIADSANICLILVHHTRKQKSDDNFNRISGTNGLHGAADGAFVMSKSKRLGNDAIVEVTGRDQPDKKYVVSRNEETLYWELKEEQSTIDEDQPEPIIEAIGKLITEENPAWEGTATDLIEKLKLDVKPNTLTLKLNVNAANLYNQYFVRYASTRNHSGRKIMLRYDENHPVKKDFEFESEEDFYDSDENQKIESVFPKKLDDMTLENSNDSEGNDHELTYHSNSEICLA